MQYIVVLILVFFFFAMSVQVAFGSESAKFTTLIETFDSLYRMPFAEEWNNMDLDVPRPLSIAYSAMFPLIFMILLNLFIAIVTEAYPQSKAKVGG